MRSGATEAVDLKNRNKFDYRTKIPQEIYRRK